MASSFLLHLLEHATSPWHACLLLQNHLSKSLEIDKVSSCMSELLSTKISNKGILVSPENDALIAWSLKEPKTQKVKIWASHIDSPTLKLKPRGNRIENGSHIFALEPYGSPIISSWMNHPLFLSGRVLIQKDHQVSQHLISLHDCLFTLEPAAIHLVRDRAEKKIDLQKELKAIVAPEVYSTAPCPLISSIAKALSLEPKEFSLLAHDLFASPLHPVQPLYDQKYLLSARIDNLVSAAAMAEEIASREDENIIGIWANHEEIGSNSSTGAKSRWIEKTISAAMEQHHLTDPVIYSIDGAHGLHPSYSDLSDPDHAPILGNGPVIKHNTQGRYRRDFQALQRLLSQNQESYQEFSMRSDLPCGSTVGPSLSASLGVSCLDIGIAQLGMHAMREMISENDYAKLKRFI